MAATMEPDPYRQLLEDHKISRSMSAKGCCWDNAVVERSQAAVHLCPYTLHHMALITVQPIGVTPPRKAQGL
jgi:transposase InsO family protein